MKKILLSAVLFGAVMAVSMSINIQPIESAEADGYGCPRGDSWNGPIPDYFVIESIDRGDWTDYNGDGLLCFKVPRGFCGNRGQGDGAPVCGGWIWKDNDNPS